MSANSKLLRVVGSHTVKCDGAQKMKQVIDTFRMLLQFADDDDSAFPSVFDNHKGPPEGAEHMWLQYARYNENNINSCCALAVGLCSFANPPEREPFLRTLLRHGVDLHATLWGTADAYSDHHQKIFPGALLRNSTLLTSSSRIPRLHMMPERWAKSGCRL